ncbi:MAG: hypothetical protein LBR57_04275 [Alistipes sp.]|jgi:hypothetical protein|nr:hypothetical protein [Alistipes sp.]
MRVNGDRGTRPLECINPPADRWIVRWDFRDEESGVSYEEQVIDHRPTLDEIRAVIEAAVNVATEETIRSGYVWRDIPVWLSSENQMNYKIAYDLAVQTGGASMPVTFKFGAEEAVYHTFETVDEFTDFYTGVARHIRDTVAEGWRQKDGLDLSLYVGQ